MKKPIKQHIISEIEKLKELKSKFGDKMSFKQLKEMKEFEHINEDLGLEMIKHLEEYAHIIVKQVMRLGIQKTKNYE